MRFKTASEFKYECGVQPVPKLGAWVEILTSILEKESKLSRRERRSTQRLFEELRGHGYDGAHDSVHQFTRAWRDERARAPSHAFVPLSFAPGEFDGHALRDPMGLVSTPKSYIVSAACPMPVTSDEFFGLGAEPFHEACLQRLERVG